MDYWGVGCYEETALELAPVADVAIAALGLSGDERVLDVACGTGNAALVAQRAGAIVTGLDSSPRLLEVARERMPSAEFVRGDAAQLPFADGRFDAAVSVSGVIFARPAEKAAAEIARVVRPGGRVVITAWPARGPMFAMAWPMRQALNRLRPPDGSTSPLAWSDPTVLETLFGRYGDLEITEHELTHRTTNPDEFWERWERLHPIWIAARSQLEPAGQWEGVREAAIAALREGAIGTGATSPYVLAVLDRR